MTRHCPHGDGEFEDWVERCPECGRPLVDGPTPATLATRAVDEPVVYLATVPNEPLARMWVDILADAGIRAMAKAIGPGYGAWASAATLEHELYVLRSQVAQAQDVIREVQSTEDAAETKG